MFDFQRTEDTALIQSIITSDHRLYDGMSDDHCPKMEDFRLPELPDAWHVLVRDGEELLGFWTLIPKENGEAEVHTCLLPTAWGNRARAAAREMAQWIWQNTPFTILSTVVSGHHRLALMFAKVSGMREMGLQKDFYLKNGKTHDLIHLEMRKPEEFYAAR